MTCGKLWGPFSNCAGSCMKPLNLRAVGLFILAVLVLQLPARAAQLASNITGASAGSWGINDTFWSGVPFTTNGQTWTVDNVVAPVSQSVGRSMDGIFMQVYSNVAGQPGAPLGTKMLTPTITAVQT